MKKYNSACSISFVVLHDNETEPTYREIMEGLKRRLEQFEQSPRELMQCVDIYDTIENG